MILAQDIKNSTQLHLIFTFFNSRIRTNNDYDTLYLNIHLLIVILKEHVVIAET